MLYLNWTAPSTQKNNARAAQAGAAAFVLGQSAKNVGLLLCPEFTYRKNELWLLEHSITKQLCTTGLSLGKSFTLQFQNKACTVSTFPKRSSNKFQSTTALRDALSNGLDNHNDLVGTLTQLKFHPVNQVSDYG